MKDMKSFLYAKNRLMLFSIVLFLLVTGAFGVNIKSSKALLGFGGEILMVIPCIDEASYAIIIGTPTPGVYLWVPGTMMFPYYNLWTPGPWVLGGYIPSPGLTCSEDTVPLAFPTGTIEEVGTSMMPI